MLKISPKKSALVLIDLQRGILAMPAEPRSSSVVLESCKGLAQIFRANESKVVVVNVGWSPDLSDVPPGKVQQPVPRPEGGLPATWSELAPEVYQPGDIRITKRQWGAFTGTELDLQLRRRGIDTIVIAGIATNFGVESTARHAWELGYNVIVVEDACATTASAELHTMSMVYILPRIARVVMSKDLEFDKDSKCQAN